VVRETDRGAEFLAIRPRGQDRLQLPKGTLETGETAEDAARREVREEAGVWGEIVARLEPISYFFQTRGSRIHKTVDYFAMRYVSGDPDDHDDEVDEALWVPAERAQSLTFPSETALVRAALNVLTAREAGP